MYRLNLNYKVKFHLIIIDLNFYFVFNNFSYLYLFPAIVFKSFFSSSYYWWEQRA